MRNDIKEFVEYMKTIIVGMLNIQVSLLKGLKKNTESEEKAKGIQEAIDVLERNINIASNITDEEIEEKQKELEKIFGKITKPESLN